MQFEPARRDASRGRGQRPDSVDTRPGALPVLRTTPRVAFPSSVRPGHQIGGRSGSPGLGILLFVRIGVAADTGKEAFVVDVRSGSVLRRRRYFRLRAYGRDREHPADCYLPMRSRCLHPGQQQGRRWPSSSSSWVRRMRRSRVISCLASSTQQMNSLRARGVMSLQALSAVGLAISALRRSPGSLCTTPLGTRGLLTQPR